LIHDGLVRNMPRHGYEVTPITLADVEDLFRLRLILEPAAMELAAGRIDAPLRECLQELCRIASYSPGDSRSVDAYRQANHEFHVLVARASGSPRLADAIERLEEESDRVFNLGLRVRDRGETVRLGHQRDPRGLGRGERRGGAPPCGRRNSQGGARRQGGVACQSFDPRGGPDGIARAGSRCAAALNR
jgi:FCD domain